MAEVVVDQISLLFEGPNYFILEILVILKRVSRFTVIVFSKLILEDYKSFISKGIHSAFIGAHIIQWDLCV